MIPLLWIVLTSFKTPDDSIAYPPKLLFQPSIEGYCNLFTTRTRQTKEYIAALPPAASECDTLVRSRNMGLKLRTGTVLELQARGEAAAPALAALQSLVERNFDEAAVGS